MRFRMKIFGKMMYKIVYKISVKSKDYERIPKNLRQRIQRAIKSRLSVDPIAVGKPMWHGLRGCYRIRIGDYRVVYKVDKDRIVVLILDIDNRRDVYD